VADAPVARVEPGRIAAVQALHPLRPLRLAALGDQVEVVPHQAVGVQLPAEPVRDPAQETDEEPAVVVVGEDQPSVDAARGQVVHAVEERRP